MLFSRLETWRLDSTDLQHTFTVTMPAHEQLESIQRLPSDLYIDKFLAAFLFKLLRIGQYRFQVQQFLYHR
jgi:hypothetical protein